MFEKVDEVVKGAEDFLKLPRGVTSRQMIPELLAGIVDLPIDAVLTDVTAAKIAKGVLGVFFALAPQHIGPMLSGRGPGGWSDRDTEDVFAMAKKWIIDVLDPNPSDLVKIANAIQNLRLGITYNDPRRIATVFGAKTWPQLQTEWANVANAFGAAFGTPGILKIPGDPGFSPGAFLAGLTRSTLSGPGAKAPEQPKTVTSTAIPGITSVYRSTQDHSQPMPPRITPRYRSSLS
jgi:hypothetical protein